MSSTPTTSTSASTPSNEVQLAVKPNTTSPVWKYFAVEIDGNGRVKNDEEAVCRLCSKDVVAKGSNTSNLISHLRVYHPLQYIDFQKMQKEKKRKLIRLEQAKEVMGSKPLSLVLLKRQRSMTVLLRSGSS